MTIDTSIPRGIQINYINDSSKSIDSVKTIGLVFCALGGSFNFNVKIYFHKCIVNGQ